MTESAAPQPRELDQALDLLIERFGHGPYEADVVRARSFYAERTGRVFEEDRELFEARTVAFLEWYAIEWPLEAHGVPPVHVALAGEAPEELAHAWRAWATSHRSLFLIEELDEGRVALQDLLGGGRFVVDERRRLHGVAPKDIVEARLVGWRARVRFGRTFCFHPAGARASIRAHIRRILAEGGTRADAIDHVASLRVKAERYRHVAMERVYEPSGG